MPSTRDIKRLDDWKAMVADVEARADYLPPAAFGFGLATISDADGTSHRVVPGTVVVLPKGWSGRWDIHETVRKLYVVVA